MLLEACQELSKNAIVPVKNNKGKIELLVAAIPYLRDTDLRTGTSVSTYEDRLQAIREGIKNIFENASAICRDKHPDVPVIAMGHLFTAGSDTSESERDIQIGNQAAFNALQFGEHFSYIALGHIHKPQRISANIPIFYSGSPLPLSFSEIKDEKRVLILDTEIDWEPESIPVPIFRKLIKISGTLSEIQLKLNELVNAGKLDSLIE